LGLLMTCRMALRLGDDLLVGLHRGVHAEWTTFIRDRSLRRGHSHERLPPGAARYYADAWAPASAMRIWILVKIRAAFLFIPSTTAGGTH